MRSLLAGTFAALALFSGAQSVPLTVVATHLNNPRKIFLGSDGAVYVVEAGTGGRDKCLGTGPNAACIGLSGSITRIANGAQKRVVTGLWSGAPPNGQRAQGPADVIVRATSDPVLNTDCEKVCPRFSIDFRASDVTRSISTVS